MSALLLRYPAARPSTVFTTNFAATENPISEGGIWTNGLATGIDWNDVKTTATGASGALVATGYNDNLAHLKTSYRAFNANQYVRTTVYRAGGYTVPVGSAHEVECLLRFSISANNARGYEVSMGDDGTQTYAFVVRWEGALGVYTPLWDPHGSIGSYTNTPTALSNNDVLDASIVGNLITLKQNGIVLGTVTDNTWGAGQPGQGYWPTNSATPISMGFKSFQADNL